MERALRIHQVSVDGFLIETGKWTQWKRYTAPYFVRNYRTAGGITLRSSDCEDPEEWLAWSRHSVLA
jgi:hypothetical protein